MRVLHLRSAAIRVIPLALLTACPIIDEGEIPTPPPVDVIIDAGTDGLPVDLTDPAALFVAKIFVTDVYGAEIDGAEVVVDGVAHAVDGVTARISGLVVGAIPVALIRAPGYIPATLTLDPSRLMEGFSVSLLAEEAFAVFDSTAGGELQMGGGSVVFAPDGIETADGFPWTGEVRVGGRSVDIDHDYIDPHGAPQAPPASLVPELFLAAENAAGQLVPVLPLASLHLELRTPSGEELQPAVGSPAQVSYALSSRLEPFFSDQFEEDVVLPVASRSDVDGTWSIDAECVVRKQGDRWSCEAELEHFSSSSPVVDTQLGCVRVNELLVSHAEDRAVRYRHHKLTAALGEQAYNATMHLVEEGGASASARWCR